MIIPCEITVWYLIPIIKSELSKKLSQQGATQKQIAQKLGVTQAAVSHYLSEKRGSCDFSLSAIDDEVTSLAEKLMGGEEEEYYVSQSICSICMKAKSNGLLCKIHKCKSQIPEDCDTCMKIGITYCQMMGGHLD